MTVFALVAAVGAGVAIALEYHVLTFALIVVALYIAFFLRRPALALVVYVATRPAVDAFVFIQTGAVTMGQVWGAGLLLIIIVFLFGTRAGTGESRRIPAPIIVLLGGYAVFAIRGNSGIAMQFGLKLALWVLLIAAVERIARTRSGQAMCFWAGYGLSIGTVVLIAVLIALDKYGSAWYTEMGAGLTEGIDQSPIPLAFLALFCVAFPLIALVLRTLPTLSLLLVSALAIEITLSFVRTALVALVPLVLVYIFVGIRRRRPAALVLAAALVAATFAVQERLATRFADLSLVTSGDASGAGSNRVAIWSSVWEEMTSSVGTMIAGAGAGTSHALSHETIGFFVDAHNDYLEFFATGGLLLVAAYAAFFAWIVRSVWLVYRDRRQSGRARTVAAIALGVVAAFFVTSLFGSISFYAALVGFALLIGLVRGMAATPGETCFDAQHSQQHARA
jgi:hypothetical protein